MCEREGDANEMVWKKSKESLSTELRTLKFIVPAVFTIDFWYHVIITCEISSNSML